MQYAILIFEGQDGFAKREAADKEAFWASWAAYSQALAQAKVMVGGAGLLPPEAATTVRQKDGKRIVQDGPYADAKEQLGGFFLVDVPDLDSALDWAAKAPAAAYGSVEVRPLLPPPPAGR